VENNRVTHNAAPNLVSLPHPLTGDFLSCLSGSELQSFCVFPCKNKRVTAYPCNYPFSPHPCKSLNFKDGKHVLEKGSLINSNNHFQPAHPAGFFIPGAPS
jgi:hypothetical protein